MISTITPNRVVVFAVGAFVAYWVAALFVPADVLRDFFNSLAFGTAVIITLTWLRPALKAVSEGADSGEWQLIIAIFLLWFVVVLQRGYVITYNLAGRPDAWSDSAISGFWPYSYMISGLLFLSAPGVQNDKMTKRSIWSIEAAVGIGCLLAGILIGKSIPSV